MGPRPPSLAPNSPVPRPVIPSRRFSPSGFGAPAPPRDRLLDDRRLCQEALLARRQLAHRPAPPAPSDCPCPKRTTDSRRSRLDRLLGHVAPEVVEPVEVARLGRE